MKYGLEVSSLSACYTNGKTATCILENLSMRVPAGQIGIIVGPSGAGKTTLLNCVAGLHAYHEGSVVLAIDSRRGAIQHTSKQTLSPLERRRIGIAFQHSHLWSHFTVRENLMHPQIWLGGISRKDARTWADYLLRKLQLEEMGDISISALSGGQKQRVAIARGLALKPDILLLDEITANQDPENVLRIFSLIRLYVADTGCTVLTVSHDMEFVRRMADKVLFLKGGKIAAEGHADEIFNDPKSSELESFINAF